MKKLILKRTTIRLLTTGLEGVNGGTIPFPTTITPGSRNCDSSVAFQPDCPSAVCQTERCPSVNNSPEC